MTRRNELPQELAGGPFDVRDALKLGVKATRLGGKDLLRPYRGVRVPAASAADLRSRCHAYQCRMPPHQVFSHVTAALLYGIPLPWRLQTDPRLHVLVHEVRCSPRMAGVVGHQSQDSPASGRLIDGLPVTSPVSTWMQLGAVLTERELIAAGDYLVSTTLERPVPLATLQELRDSVAAGKRHRGIRRLRNALPRVRTGVESPKETEVRLIVVDAGLPEPVTNFTIRDSAGHHVARIDLAFLDYRVGLDYEGDVHRLDLRQFRKDITRVEDVRDLDWRLIRLTADDLAAGGRTVVARTERNLRARGWRPAR